MSFTKRIKYALKDAVNSFKRNFEEYTEEKWNDYCGGVMTKAGVTVNEKDSLSLSAIFCGLNNIASIIATIPKSIRKRTPDGGSQDAKDHPLYDRLKNKPNASKMTSWDWVYSQVMHKYLFGNMYTWIRRGSYMNQELILLKPDKTRMDPENINVYIADLKNETIRIPASQMLHVPHITLDGLTGKGFVHYARETLGIAKVLDEFTSRYFSDGVHPSGIVEVEKPYDPKNKEALMEDFNQKYRGLGKIFKVLWLFGGAKFKKEEIDAEKMQHLQSRQFTVLEAARFLNLPPHILKDLSRATFSNIEQQSIELVVYCLTPLVTQIEQAMNIAFFDDEERKEYYVKFELKGLLRGDLQTRSTYYTMMLDRGVFNADDVLQLEDMNPQPDGMGKIYLTQLNMVDKKTLLQQMDFKIKQEEKSLDRNNGIELRGSSDLRRKITISYKEKLAGCAKRIVKKEIKLIREKTEEFLNKKSFADFKNWLDHYYKEFGKEIKKIIQPLIASYATTILPVVQNEISSTHNITVDYQVFVRQYMDAYIDRHISTTKKQLQRLLQDENLIDAIEQKLEAWQENRTEKIVMHELVRMENAFTKKTFSLCGITKIKSVAYGESCRFCEALNGKIVGINESFLDKGEFKPEGADNSLKINRKKGHGPYHKGCDCGIEAVR